MTADGEGKFDKYYEKILTNDVNVGLLLSHFFELDERVYKQAYPKRNSLAFGLDEGSKPF